MAMKDELAVASGAARVGDLVEDFKKCTPWRGGWNRLDWNVQTRDAVWDGQAADGKKHAVDEKTPAFPWEGASDARVFAADDICNENVALCVVGFFRAMIRFAGVEAKDGEMAGDATRFMERLMEGPGFSQLLEEVELSAQLMQELGIFVLQPTMEREAAMELREIRMKELADAAGMSGAGGVAQSSQSGTENTEGGGSVEARKLIELVLNPALEAEAIAFVQEMGTEILQAEFAEFLETADCAALEEWKISKERAREFVRGLRTEGCGALPVPVVTKNAATVVALRPWDEVFFRSYAVDLSKQARVYRREWMEEVEFRARGAMEGWDADWMEAAIRTKGKTSQWNGSGWGTVVNGESWSANGSWAPYQDVEGLIEVLYGFQRCVEEDGVLSYWVTVFSAHASPEGARESAIPDAFCGKHEQVDKEDMGFVLGLRERRGRGVQRVRGVPEVVASRQREMKAHRDSLVDLASMAVIPPVNIPQNAMKTRYRFGPGVQNTVSPGMEPKFAEVPTQGAPLAIEALQRLERELDIEFGRDREDVAPSRTAAKKQMLMNTFLGTWSVALQGMWRLVVKNTSASEYARVTGGQKPTGDAARRGEDLILHFDVRDLDMEHVQALYGAFKDLVTIDAGGVIDKAKLVNVMARMVNPSVAREVIVPGQGASQQLFKQVQDDLLKIFTGNEPNYSEDADPTAPMQLQFAQQILKSNPKYQQQMAKGDADATERLQKYLENKQFSVTQQQNKVVGRIGVQPQAAGVNS